MRYVWPCVAVLLFGCAVRRPVARVDTAREIRDRTGFATAPESGPTEALTLPPGITLDRPLSADDVAAVAVWRNTQLRADLSTLGIARADVIDAGLLRNPRLDLLFPVGAKPFELVMTMPSELLWQRPRRVEATQAAYDQLAQSLIQNGLNVVRDARLAHAEQVLAIARQQAAERVLELRRKIVQLTGVRLRTGDISELEIMAAKNEAATADEQLTRTRHDLSIAMERLRIVTGFSLERTPFEIAGAPVDLTPPPSAEDLVAKALQSRPDLRAAEVAVTAATKRGKWERSRYLLLSGLLSSKGVGTNGILTGPGLSVEVPIFHRNQGLIARADAEVEAASHQYLNLKQRAAFEVYESRALLVQAQDALRRLRDAVVPPLRETVDTAQRQYEKGDVSYLFVLEQSRGLVDAELRIADAEAAVRRGQAQLERSVGTK